MKRLFCLAVAAAVWLQAGAVFGEEIVAITRPSADVTLRFVKPGRIAKMLVKEGDEVQAGQIIAQQDDAAEQAQLAQLKAQAEDTVQIRAAEAQLAQKKVEVDKLKVAYAKQAVSKFDVEHAELEVTLGELGLELAKFRHAQDGLKYDENRIDVERMKLVSPVAGKVEKIMLKTGESADPQQDVIRIVQVNPLWIDVPVPVVRSEALKIGDAADIHFEGTVAPVATGKVILIAAVADAASNTRNVRVELVNAARPAGEHVTVSFK